jgi:hypothetical protein
MTIGEWLLGELVGWKKDLSEEAEGYVLGRGLPEWLMLEIGVGLVSPSQDPAPDELFRKRNGPCAEWRRGWLSAPIWAPRGSLLGVEFRRWDGEKGMQEFRLSEASTAPAFLGLTPTTFDKIWKGGDVWLVEGLFDLALTHAVPEKDVVLACGTARVSRNHINFLSRFLGRGAMVHIAFDEDETGVSHVLGYEDEKTNRRVPGVLERLERAQVERRHVRYRGGKDPGEIWESGGRPALQSSFGL